MSFMSSYEVFNCFSNSMVLAAFLFESKNVLACLSPHDKKEGHVSISGPSKVLAKPGRNTKSHVPKTHGACGAVCRFSQEKVASFSTGRRLGCQKARRGFSKKEDFLWFRVVWNSHG